MSKTDLAESSSPTLATVDSLVTPPPSTTTPDTTVNLTKTQEITNNNQGTGTIKPKRRRRKRQSYQQMMADITKQTRTDTEIKAEHQKKIRSVLGGGTFQKMERC